MTLIWVAGVTLMRRAQRLQFDTFHAAKITGDVLAWAAMRDITHVRSGANRIGQKPDGSESIISLLC
jgi:hypothetical protein